MIKIYPMAFDSFGVRSMSTLVKAGKLAIHLDPGVALGPSRYGLPPAQAELKACEIARRKIMEVCKQSEVVIITHYHYDHHPFPDDYEMYECLRNKLILAKDRNKNINLSGKKRGKIFEENLKGADLRYADGKEFEFKGVKFVFSKAVWHGDVGSKVGKVIMVYIEKKDSLIFGSDAQSLADPEALKWVLEFNPKILILDGYPTIFVGWRMSEKNFRNALENLKIAINKTEAKKIILDHHLVRDLKFREKIKEIYQLAKELDKQVLTAAEFCSIENFFLEAWRKDLHKRMEVDVEKYYEKLYSKLGI